MEQNVQLKNSLGSKAIEKIARILKPLVKEFKEKSFKKDALEGIEKLELKQRVHHIIKF
ncbi:MAG: hypothetical protein JEY94_05090 [Melioribacteraceae bacterium]|nr:hypothetical protein [Melioribacteraceae bacterium]